MVAGQEFFESNPNVRGGELFAAETRISVTVILDSLAEGSTQEEILRSYPPRNGGTLPPHLPTRGNWRTNNGSCRGGCPNASFLTYVFLALFFIQIGVPTKPKASRIWFSRKRW